MERTFVILKPDAVQRGLTGTIIQRIEQKGLKIIAMKLLTITIEQAEKQYECHKGKPFYPSLIAFMTSGPSVAMILEGRNAVAIFRKFIGSTDPVQSEPGTIRGDFSIDVKHNLIHASDCEISFKHESSIYFSDEEIQKYKLSLKGWLYYEGK
ncbi:MAG: nucleoside-diphosphate kinase [Candidatus Riflebacteria bacterium]|nr:nucleoside-diphosphate kinase [Candidatus Riflebacteria bacterium]